MRELLEYPEVLVKKLLIDDTGNPFVLTSYQRRFLKDVLLKKYKKYIFCAATRSGKSEVISIAILLLALIYPREEIVVISATWNQSRIIFEKAKKHLFDHPEILKEVDMSNEFSKQEINFKNGSKIKCMSAGGGSKGESLLGFGASVLVIDESGSIPDEVYYTKIIRMITTGRKERTIIESGTPHIKNHFFETFNNPNYKRYHVSWKEAAKEGQMSKEEVLQAKERLSEIEFTMWYEAEFPEEGEKSLFSYKDVLYATEKEIKGKGTKILGVDVARYGTDLTVLTSISIIEDEYRVDSIISLKKTSIMNVVGEIIRLDRENKYDKIYVDIIGIGAGVVDRLRELESMQEKVFEAHFGEAPNSEEAKKRFLNKKAEQYVRLSDLFKQKRISIPKNKQLIDQLLQMTYEFTSNGKLKIIDPEKSPDFADSLVYATWHEETGFILDW
jgi:hypothetical protein